MVYCLQNSMSMNILTGCSSRIPSTTEQNSKIFWMACKEKDKRGTVTCKGMHPATSAHFNIYKTQLFVDINSTTNLFN